MKITRTITAEVKRCQDCPWFFVSMDGAECQKMIDIKDDVYGGFVYPEGRDAIHPDCPFLAKEERKAARAGTGLK